MWRNCRQHYKWVTASITIGVSKHRHNYLANLPLNYATAAELQHKSDHLASLYLRSFDEGFMRRLSTDIVHPPPQLQTSGRYTYPFNETPERSELSFPSQPRRDALLKTVLGPFLKIHIISYD